MTSILISGASIAGPTLAYWLRKAGFAPTLIERGPAMRPGGQAIDIRGVALAVIDGMELLATAREKRTQMRGVSMIDETGKEIWRSEERTLSGGRFDNDDVEILKDDLSTLLYDATKNDCEYLFRTTIASLAEDAAGVSVTFDNGATRRFDLVIAADGLRSNTRRMVFGADDAIYRDLGSHLAVFSAPNILALDNWQIGYRNERAGFLIYPARDNAELRVAFGFGSDPSDDVRDVQAQKSLVAQRCAGLPWEAPRLLKSMWDAPDFYLGSMAQIVMDRWSQGRVALVGDAGYCPSPMSGQGTSLAIVGAYVLAQELGRAFGDHRAAFSAYEARMRPFVERNQALATMERPDGRLSDKALNSAKNAILLD
jgi:2-polyprenyl-6-methoxyphenol hydroxylase-like FAD-dependent oxidoreductase